MSQNVMTPTLARRGPGKMSSGTADSTQDNPHHRDFNRTQAALVALTWVPLGSAVERVFARLAEKAKEAAR